MLNHIVLMGRLTRDPELRYTQSQIPVASFRLAVDRDFGGRDGGELHRHCRLEKHGGVCLQVLHQGQHGRRERPSADPRMD